MIKKFKYYKKLFLEFIDLRWIAIFLLFPTLIFMLDVYIDYGWIITYYVIFIFLIVSGYIKFIKDENL